MVVLGTGFLVPLTFRMVNSVLVLGSLIFTMFGRDLVFVLAFTKFCFTLFMLLTLCDCLSFSCASVGKEYAKNLGDSDTINIPFSASKDLSFITLPLLSGLSSLIRFPIWKDKSRSN